MDRLLFGDNQFFGVNHMSEEKARAQQMRFQRLDSVMNVLGHAVEAGARTFMCTTHDRVAEICREVRRDPARWAGLQFMPCMPYAHKYANAVTDDGFLGAVRRFTPQEGLLDAVAKGTKSLATKDVDGLATLLVDAEMRMFDGLPTPVIWLQNVVVDLLLGLGAHEPLRTFADHVRSRYGVEPGFITMNLPMLLDALDRVGVENPMVCANINKLGFRMPGGVDAYLDSLSNRQFRAVAMSVFASGAIPAEEAIEWVCGLPNLESIVFGASSRANIESTARLVGKYWAQ
ncbi:hypothetical protein [Ornithinimicrobium sufpigmenti]|uniref:hypothetical protein n=1 Tax=Ornithinimicrobium sufpigmenti TaxID=2508882 RepID=UPI001EE0FB4A|nr:MULTISPECIES: hypothetical protein [unclassified Ornithinimicrobium]